MDEIVRKEDGAGGKYMMEFLKRHIISRFNSKANEISLSDLDDSSDFFDYTFTTDSYVVNPPIFPGGSIGSLAICGTSNDLAVMGAEPKFFSLSLILQDGFKIETLEKILSDIEFWLKEIDAKIITGDTKVVDSNVGIVINTSGIGVKNDHLRKNIEVVKAYRDYPYSWVRDKGMKDGEAIIISGNIAEHGVAILAFREGFEFELEVKSDVYPVWKFVKEALDVGGITAMKDATRGGIAGVLNEMAEKSGVGILIEEERIPIRDDVRSFCELLGLEPLNMANEGKVVMSVVADLADDVLKIIRKHDKNAEIVGYTTKEFKEVVMETVVGTKKIVPQPLADPIPRVC